MLSQNNLSNVFLDHGIYVDEWASWTSITLDEKSGKYTTERNKTCINRYSLNNDNITCYEPRSEYITERDNRIVRHICNATKFLEQHYSKSGLIAKTLVMNCSDVNCSNEAQIEFEFGSCHPKAENWTTYELFQDCQKRSDKNEWYKIFRRNCTEEVNLQNCQCQWFDLEERRCQPIPGEWTEWTDFDETFCKQNENSTWTKPRTRVCQGKYSADFD